MKKLIITAFEPFDTHQENPTVNILHALPNNIGRIELRKHILPVAYLKSFELLEAIIHQEDVIGVIMLGLAAGRTHITFEQIAINLNHATIADNHQSIKLYEKIIEEGLDGYFSTLPLKDILQDLENKNFPVKLSLSAGGYVCNDLFYRVLHYTKTQNQNLLSGFVHVPYHRESNTSHAYPMLPLNTMIDTIYEALKYIILYYEKESNNEKNPINH